MFAENTDMHHTNWNRAKNRDIRICGWLLMFALVGETSNDLSVIISEG